MLHTTFRNTIETPVPKDVDPQSLIDILHDHSHLITMSPIVTRHELRDHDRATGKRTYNVWEDIDLLPFGWWKKEIQFQCSFEDQQNGVISWIEAPMGLTSKAEYIVHSGPAGDGQGMVLEKRIESGCHVMFRPFVEWTMVPVRKKMHAQMLAQARDRAENARS